MFSFLCAYFKIIDQFYYIDIDVVFFKNIKIQKQIRKHKKQKKIFGQGHQKCKKRKMRD